MQQNESGPAENPNILPFPEPDADQDSAGNVTDMQAYVVSFVNRLKLEEGKVPEELRRLLDSGEIETLEPYELNDLWNFVQAERPVTRSYVGRQAIILTADELEQLGAFDVIDAHGRRITIQEGCIPAGHTLIIPPGKLGTEEGKPTLGVVR